MKPYLILAFTLLAGGAALVVFRLTPGWLLDEGGLIETLTVVLYAALIGGILYFRKMKWSPGNYFSAFIVLMLMFRELDFDKAFTTMGFFKSSFFVSPDVSPLEKTVVSLVIIAILVVFIGMLWRYRGALFEGLVRFKRPQWGVFTAFAFAFVSKIFLDGLPRKLDGFGLTLDGYLLENHQVFEEVLELGIPIALIMSLYYLVRERRVALV